MEFKNAWESYTDKELKELEVLCAGYKGFLDEGKTERECVDLIVDACDQSGYVELETLLEERSAAANKPAGRGRRPAPKTLKPGDKVYAVCMNKAVVMFQIGKDPIEKGMNILGAHIDSPRLDIKQNPLYEDGGYALLDTHYYGGIKKYQWVTIPLALHGVVVKKDGTTIELAIGEEDDDPVFFVSDLLIHLAYEQVEKKASKVIEGEALDIIVGNKPLKVKADGDKADADKAASKAKKGAGAKAASTRKSSAVSSKDSTEAKDASEADAEAKKSPVKAMILKILKDDYGMEEADFLSAELEVVPAGKARDAGLDRSMILAYGQDDRVCAYTSLVAMLECKNPARTSCCILVDKEEIGSVGATGMQSRFFENSVAELLALMGVEGDLALRRTLANSCMLSSDVNAAFDPLYASAFEKKNASMMGSGMVFNKFTGSRGKSGSNDANAEYIAYLRRILGEAGVHFQTSELGKVDLGGGGTIAYILALYGMNVIDSGVAVLCMHAPYEVTSKADIYETKKGYAAFLKGPGL